VRSRRPRWTACRCRSAGATTATSPARRRRCSRRSRAAALAATQASSAGRGRPARTATLVQNVETLARVPAAIADPGPTGGPRRRSSRCGATSAGPVSTRCRSERRCGASWTSTPAAERRRSAWSFPGAPPARRCRPTGSTPRSTRTLCARRAPRSHRVGPRGRRLGLSRRSGGVGGRLLRAGELRQCPPCAVGTASLARILRAVEAGPPARATCATSARWPASCPATATAPTAARRPRGHGHDAGLRRGGTEHVGAGCPGAATRTRSPPARPSAPRSSPRSRSSCDEIPDEERPDRPDPATILSYPIGLALKQPWLLPVLNALPAYVVLVHRLRKGERGAR